MANTGKESVIGVPWAGGGGVSVAVPPLFLSPDSAPFLSLLLHFWLRPEREGG